MHSLYQAFFCLQTKFAKGKKNPDSPLQNADFVTQLCLMSSSQTLKINVSNLILQITVNDITKFHISFSMFTFRFLQWEWFLKFLKFEERNK